jgi:hypothetical protein
MLQLNRSLAWLFLHPGSFWCAVSVFLTTQSALGIERVAFVIGNDSYAHAPVLRNAGSDARLIGKILTEGGFKVIALENAGIESFYSGMEEFKRNANTASIGLFYFAGHGIETDGKNFLLPVDAELTSASQLRTQAVSIDSVLEDFATTKITAKLLILDCCRNNPLSRSWISTRSGSQGFAEIKDMDIPQSTMIMFSAGPGQIALDGNGGNNSPFTSALAEKLPQPGISIFDAFLETSDAVARTTSNRQEPWVKFDGSGRAFRDIQIVSQSRGVPTNISAVTEGAMNLPLGNKPVPPSHADGESEEKIAPKMSSIEAALESAKKEKGVVDLQSLKFSSVVEFGASLKPNIEFLDRVIENRPQNGQVPLFHLKSNDVRAFSYWDNEIDQLRGDGIDTQLLSDETFIRLSNIDKNKIENVKAHLTLFFLWGYGVELIDSSGNHNLSHFGPLLDVTTKIAETYSLYPDGRRCFGDWYEIFAPRYWAGPDPDHFSTHLLMSIHPELRSKLRAIHASDLLDFPSGNYIKKFGRDIDVSFAYSFDLKWESAFPSSMGVTIDLTPMKDRLYRANN